MAKEIFGIGARKPKKRLKLKRNSHLNKGVTERFSEVQELEGIENSGASQLFKPTKKKIIQI